jgi:hypothetical protein
MPALSCRIGGVAILPNNTYYYYDRSKVSFAR